LYAPSGLTHTIPAIDADIDDVRNTFETNVFAVMAMVKAFSSLLIAARGRIVNISSLASITPYAYGSIFCATKGAINSYSRTLRQELRPFGVKVTVVMAGFVKTKTNKTYRQLPNGSFYSVVEDQFRRRLTYSEDTSQMAPETFAIVLVRKCLTDNSKKSSYLWGLFGRRLDWLWIGGSATLVRCASWVGEWLLDAVAYRKFELHKLEAIVNAESNA
jgi:1-acylglycerone phosphate reductase